MGPLFSFCVALFISSVPLANDVHSVVRALERRYQHAATLRAVFFERYTDGNGGVAAESGTVYFSRPGRMRWEYESPESKLFLVDGTNVWFYVPADRTASRAKLKESSDWRTPVALLAGKADLAQMCSHIELVNPTVTAVGKSNETTAAPGAKPNDAPASGDSMLRCAPRGSSDKSADAIREILFEVDSNSDLVRVVIRQPGNAETEFRFGAWQLNIPIAEAKFHFEAPPGVAIVDEATLAGALR